MQQPADYFDKAYQERIIGKAKAMALIQKWANACVSRLTGADDVIDLGCGLGALSRLFTRHYVGVDFSQAAVDYANEHHKRRNAKFVCADLHDFAADLDDDSHDAVVLCVVLQHLNDPAAIVKEAKRIARDRVIVIVPMDAANVSHVKAQWTAEDVQQLMGDTSELVDIGGFWLAIWEKGRSARQSQGGRKTASKRKSKKAAEEAPQPPVIQEV